jgi:hypothetical protein
MTTQILPAGDGELEWLHNGLDEEAIERSDSRDLERAIDASPTPKHWRPVEVERVG